MLSLFYMGQIDPVEYVLSSVFRHFLFLIYLKLTTLPVLRVGATNNPRHHVDRMKELWKEFPEDGKPEWLTWEQILQYEKNICK